jgi:uncharacterized protein YxjI
VRETTDRYSRTNVFSFGGQHLKLSESPPGKLRPIRRPNQIHEFMPRLPATVRIPEGVTSMFRDRRSGGRRAAAPAPIAEQTTDAADSTHRYRMVEKLVSIGDDFWIQNDSGQRVFKVDGKSLRVRDTLVFRDPQDNVVCKVQQRLGRIRDTMEVEGPSGQRMAMVKKAMITPLRDRFVVKVGDGPDLEVQGNIVSHEYRIGNVATVSKKWFRVRDSYGVEVAPGQNDLLILATTVCIEQMASNV